MENCKLCGKSFENDEKKKALLGDEGRIFCEECETGIYIIKNIEDMEVYKKHVIWANRMIKSPYVDDDTKKYMSDLIKQRNSDDAQDEKSETQPLRSPSTKSTWTNLVKFLSVILIIVFTLFGAIIGNSMIDNEGVGVLVGLIVGGIFGSVSVAIIMLFVEMAENIAAGVDLLNIINSKIKK